MIFLFIFPKINSKSISGLFLPASLDYDFIMTMEPLKGMPPPRVSISAKIHFSLSGRVKFANSPQTSKNAKYDSPQQTGGGGGEDTVQYQTSLSLLSFLPLQLVEKTIFPADLPNLPIIHLNAKSSIKFCYLPLGESIFLICVAFMVVNFQIFKVLYNKSTSIWGPFWGVPFGGVPVGGVPFGGVPFGGVPFGTI